MYVPVCYFFKSLNGSQFNKDLEKRVKSWRKRCTPFPADAPGGRKEGGGAAAPSSLAAPSTRQLNPVEGKQIESDASFLR